MRVVVPRWALLLVILLTVAGVGMIGSVAVAEEEYELRVTDPDPIDTPEETITLEGDDYDVDSVATVDPDETIEIDVSVPEGTNFAVYLYNEDKAVAVSESGKGPETVTIDSSDLGATDEQPGTYMIALSIEGDIEVVHPLVISGYDISVEYPDEAEDGEEFDVTAEVVPDAASDQPSELRVVFWTDESTTKETLDHTGGTSYESTVSLSDADEYNVHASAFAGRTIEGYPVSLGIEEGAPIEITPKEDENDGDDDNGDSDGDGGGSDGGSGGAGGGGGGGGGESQLLTSFPSVSDTTPETGEEVEISLDLRNSGDGAAYETLAIYANDEAIEEVDITMTSGSERDIAVDHAFTQPGEYEITAESESLGTVTVDTVTVTGDPIEESTGDDTDADTPEDATGAQPDEGANDAPDDTEDSPSDADGGETVIQPTDDPNDDREDGDETDATRDEDGGVPPDELGVPGGFILGWILSVLLIGGYAKFRAET